MRYTTYIFDLDGTLLNTLGDLAASVNYALAANGQPTHTIEEVRLAVGNGVGKLMERMLPNGLDNPAFTSVLQEFQQHYLLHSADLTAPYPGILSMLAELRRRGVQVAVVSNKFQAATTQLCQRFFNDMVQVAVGDGPDVRRKPAPDGVLLAMRKLGAEPDSTIYIGDSDTDIATARASQLPCVSVTWGFRDRQFLIDHDATTVIDTPQELLNL